MNSDTLKKLTGDSKTVLIMSAIEYLVFLGGFLFIIFVMGGCAATLQNKDTHWVGIQRLEYVIQGDGSPTVLFNSNTDMDSWIKVLPEVAKFTKVFADNRPGYGSSKPAMGQNTGKSVVERLHQLLEETGQRPPYVLVGHSYSGLFTNLFARTYPDEVAGVIFVDASHPAQEDWWHTNRPFESLLIHEFSKATYNWEHFAFQKVAEDLREAGPFPNIPIIVITAGKEWILDTQAWRDQWMRFQLDLVSLSPQGKHIIATESGHNIQDQQPDLVINAIREIVEQVRKKGSSDSTKVH
jgi:pimeloyl-ACP methyl ester carboxylesterase